MKQSSEDGNESVHMEYLLATHCDRMLDGNSKKDQKEVISIYESVLCRIQKDCPRIDEVSCQSDNARFYQNIIFLHDLVLMPNSRETLKIANFIHSEIRDGACIIDAHFSVAMGHTRQRVN